jgi:hypothetical protein
VAIEQREPQLDHGQILELGEKQASSTKDAILDALNESLLTRP